ncbi:hypothetical protein DL765_001710 [Monosporascus sp. GIB2]|nr:hypothetical protein DL765_001710 [Monosporascus sp. GIB2]
MYGKVRPISPTTIFPISEVESALKTLHGAKMHGKLIVVPHANDIVKATPPKKPHQFLKENATYILIGGTGGLGRSMSRWMALRSWSAVAMSLTPADIEELITHGLEGMPPVKGVIHGAIVLRDVLFEKMTYSDFTTVIESKAEALAAVEASAGAVKTISYNAPLKSAGTLREAEYVVCEGLMYKLATVMMMESEDLDATRPLSNYPLGSLVAIEIRNFITREFEATLQVLELSSSGSIQTLAKAVCIKSKLVKS